MFRFSEPYFLLLLVPVGVALALGARGRSSSAIRVSSLAGMPRGKSLWLRLLPAVSALKAIAIMLAAVAMAGPQWGTEDVVVLTEGINIVLAVDASESMAALDFERGGETLNRLEAVKTVVKEFIGGRYGDRIGLVVFGSEAYTQVPLTRDYDTVELGLDAIQIGAAGKSTAIGDALGISLKRLRDVPSKSNVVILLTDGRSNTGVLTPGTATGAAVSEGVKAYTIGVGGYGPAPFRLKSPFFGERTVYQQVDIDEQALKDMALATGGEYFRATDTETLANIYKRIDELEKTEVKVKTHADYRELYPWFIGPALAMLMLWALLVNTRCLRVP